MLTESVQISRCRRSSYTTCRRQLYRADHFHHRLIAAIAHPGGSPSTTITFTTLTENPANNANLRVLSPRTR
jgi:hypothetical protein